MFTGLEASVLKLCTSGVDLWGFSVQGFIKTRSTLLTLLRQTFDDLVATLYCRTTSHRVKWTMANFG